MDPDKLPERLRSKFTVNQATGCWEWHAATDRLGYSRVRWRIDGQPKVWFGHRVIYQELTGTLPAELDHLCRVHNCVNPEHLEPVTHPLEGANLYLYVKKETGVLNRMCRTCRAEGKRRRRAAGKRE